MGFGTVGARAGTKDKNSLVWGWRWGWEDLRLEIGLGKLGLGLDLRLWRFGDEGGIWNEGGWSWNYGCEELGFEILDGWICAVNMIGKS